MERSKEFSVLKLHRQFSKTPLVEVVSDPTTGMAGVRLHELLDGSLRRRTRWTRLSVEGTIDFVEVNLEFFLAASKQRFAYLLVTDFFRSLGAPHYQIAESNYVGDAASPVALQREDEGESEEREIKEHEGSESPSGDRINLSDGGKGDQPNGTDPVTEVRNSTSVDPAAAKTKEINRLKVPRLPLKQHFECVGVARPKVEFHGPFAAAAWGTQYNIIVLTPGLAIADELPWPVAIPIRRMTAVLNYPESDQVDLLIAPGCISGRATDGRTFEVPVSKAESVHPADVMAYTTILEKATYLSLPDGRLQEFAEDLLKALSCGTKASDRKDAVSSVHIIRTKDGVTHCVPSEYATLKECEAAAEEEVVMSARHARPVFEQVAKDSSPQISFLGPELGLGIRLGDGGQVGYVIAPYGRKLPQFPVMEAANRAAGTHAVTTSRSGTFVPSAAIGEELKKDGIDLTEKKLGGTLRDMGAPTKDFEHPVTKVHVKGPKLEDIRRAEANLVKAGVAPGGTWRTETPTPCLVHEYLPAIGPYVVDAREWRHPIHPFDPAVEIFYPRFMAGYALWRDQPLPATREDATIVGDSGGYQVVTQNADFDPEEVISWQMKYCTRGLILDIPPYHAAGSIQFRGVAAEAWDESLSRTVLNVEQALPHYQPTTTPFRWWGVVQGETPEQMTEWHGRIAEVYPFSAPGEGWALAPKPSTDLLSCARYMRFANEQGLRRVHLLQVSGDRQVGVVLGLAALSGNFELVSYDSSTAMEAVNGVAVIPDGLGMSYLNEKRSEGETTVLDYVLKCPCQACEWHRMDHPLTNAEYPHYIFLHNHLTMVAALERIYQEALRDPDGLLRWAADRQYDDVMEQWDKQA